MRDTLMVWFRSHPLHWTVLIQLCLAKTTEHQEVRAAANGLPLETWVLVVDSSWIYAFKIVFRHVYNN